jgi:DNA (cytosine-5)-methyltransferase 1
MVLKNSRTTTRNEKQNTRQDWTDIGEGEMKPTHVDLFSGIDGFALAAKWAGYQTVAFCEINPFCQQIIKKNFGKDVKIYGDIRKLAADSFYGRQEKCEKQTTGNKQCDSFTTNSSSSRIKNLRQERKNSIHGFKQIDLLTGGFPCQPASCAGKRKGTADNRWLWPEMLRVIKEFEPTWIIGENVNGLASLVEWTSDLEMGGEADFFEEERKIYEREGSGILNGICSDLESLGYEVQPLVIPACAVNAPHRRDRIWIVGHSGRQYGKGTKDGGEPKGQISSQEDASMSERSIGNDEQGDDTDTERQRSQVGQEAHKTRLSGVERDSSHASDAISKPVDIRRHGTEPICRKRRQASGVQGREVTADPLHTKRQFLSRQQSKQGQETQQRNGNNFGQEEQWNRDWLEVATELCRLDDGLSVELGKFKLSKSKHREEQLKAYGNAIVPQVAYQIMKAIQEIEQ